jgi:polyphosphate glucokinase
VKVLVIDIGGTNVKLLATGRRAVRKLSSGPELTPRQLVKEVLPAAGDWDYDVVSIGFPGPVQDNRPMREPVNLGKGWVRFDYESALGKPVRMVNDAAMQAIGRTTLVRTGTVIPLELGHLPYRKGRTFEDYIGDAGYRQLGKAAWRKHVAEVVRELMNATVADYVVLGGGNVRHLKKLPPRTRRGDNANAFRGGYRLWQENTTWT